MVALAREVGAPEELRELTAAEVRARCDSPAFRGGAFMRDGASVQPGLLVRGLRRVVLERGVKIFEGTTATGLEAGPPALVTTARGAVRAKHAVLALNAWATGWPRSEEHTSELQSHLNLVCRLLLEKKKKLTSFLFRQWIRGRHRLPPRHRHGRSRHSY